MFLNIMIMIMAGAAVSAAQDGGAPVSIGEIVVTAQKREQRLQNVPISMEVVSAKKIEDLNINDFRQMVKLVPNVSVVQSPGNDAIFIRGFGSSPGNYAFDPSVSLYVDGIYTGRQKQSQGPFFDLERVEVLRGPQGALFGKNTAAGAVSVVSAGPTKQFRAGAKALYNFDLEGPAAEGYVAGPLSEQLGVRLAVKLRDQDGYIDNRGTGNEDVGVRQALARLTVRYEPSQSFNYTVKAEYGDLKTFGGNNVSQSLTGPKQRPVTTRFTNSPSKYGEGDEGTKTESFLVSGTGNLSLGEHTLTSVTGYSWFKGILVNAYDLTIPGTTGVTNNSVYNLFPERFDQFSQEVRFASPSGGRFEYLVGGYYDESNYSLGAKYAYDIRAVIPPVFPYVGGQESSFSQRVKSYSVFGQSIVRLTPELRLIGSLRYAKTKKRGEYGGKLNYGPFPLQALSTARGRINESSIDPSLTAQYDVARKIMVYATYARGSKSGGFVSNTFGTTDANFVFSPEKSESLEAGVKSSFADGQVVLNVAVYDMKFKNLQVSIYNGNRASFETRNAAKARSRGIEVTTALYPVRGLDFSASAAYQDAKYTDFPGGGCLASQPLTACNPRVPASILANNLGGTRLPYSSKFSYSVQGHYRLELAGRSAIDTTISLNGRSNFFTAADLSPLYGLQKAYTKVDARIQYAPIGERWHLAVLGTNLTNKKTVSSTYFFPFPITSVPRAFLHVDPTRNIAVEAGFKF